jgi:hypothetical protein
MELSAKGYKNAADSCQLLFIKAAAGGAATRMQGAHCKRNRLSSSHSKTDGQR